MGQKIKLKENKTKIKKPSQNESRGCISEQYPWFSFRYMTQNSNYSLKFLDSLDCSYREKTLKGLYMRLEELSKQPWIYWQEKRKSTGTETINIDQLNFSANADANFTKDMKAYVFRFDTYQGNNSGRIIGVKLSLCAVLHIIGYDFDFSAYSHG